MKRTKKRTYTRRTPPVPDPALHGMLADYFRVNTDLAAGLATRNDLTARITAAMPDGGR